MAILGKARVRVIWAALLLCLFLPTATKAEHEKRHGRYELYTSIYDPTTQTSAYYEIDRLTGVLTETDRTFPAPSGYSLQAVDGQWWLYQTDWSGNSSPIGPTGFGSRAPFVLASNAPGSLYAVYSDYSGYREALYSISVDDGSAHLIGNGFDLGIADPIWHAQFGPDGRLYALLTGLNTWNGVAVIDITTGTAGRISGPWNDRYIMITWALEPDTSLFYIYGSPNDGTTVDHPAQLATFDIRTDKWAGVTDLKNPAPVWVPSLFFAPALPMRSRPR